MNFFLNYQFLSLLITILIVIYIYYILRFTAGLKNRNESMQFYKYQVSVVVAARNEEKSLPFLLTALVNQSYPSDCLEILVADDCSTDGTAAIINDFSAKWPHVKYLEVQGRKKARSPKKNALAQAIKEARGEIILTTDADCLVSKYWVESMVSSFTNDVSMVSGFSKVSLTNWKKRKFANKFEYFDFMALMITAAGATSIKKYFSCTGQNLGFRKDCFEKVRGYNDIMHIISGDDVNLMQLFRKKLPTMKIKFNFNSHSFVKTEPCSSLKKLFFQRVRWASNAKWQFFYNSEFFIYLSIILLIYFTAFLLFFFNIYIAIGTFVLKFIIDYFFLNKHFKIFEQNTERMNFFPTWFLIHPFYVITTALFGILGAYKWKDRSGSINC